MSIISENLRTPVTAQFDVAVLGGGVAGCAAALACARQGRKTLLIEKMVCLGGLATAGHVVIYLPLCHGRGRKAAAGIAEEFLRLSIAQGNGTLPEAWADRPLTAKTDKRYETWFNAGSFALGLEELLVQNGVTLWLDTLFCRGITAQGRCTALIVENKSGRQAVQVKAVVDASGEADGLFRMGAPTAQQDNFVSFWCYGAGKGKNALPQGVKLLTLGSCTGEGLPEGTPKYLGTTGEAVNGFLRVCHHLAYEQIIKGMKDEFVMASFPSMPQFRTTRRIIGAYDLSEKDVNTYFADAVGAIGDWRTPGPVYELPYRCLYSPALANVYAAGRNIGAEGDAWEVTRVIPAAAVTGQAAGTAAAMIAQSGQAAWELSVPALQTKLTEAGGLLHYFKA